MCYSRQQLNEMRNMELIRVNEELSKMNIKIEKPIRKKMKKLKVVGVYEEPQKKLKVVGVYEEPKEIKPCPIDLVFSNSDIRQQIMEHKQKLIDDDWDKFKSIDWREIMTIDEFRDIITEYARGLGSIDERTRYNLKLNWTGLENVIYNFDHNCDLDFYGDNDYYTRRAFQRKLNGEPLIDTTYQRQYPPKKPRTPNRKKHDGIDDEDTIEACKMLRKKYKNKKVWAKKLTQIARDNNLLDENKHWTGKLTIEDAIRIYIRRKQDGDILNEYSKSVELILEEEGIEILEY